MAGGPSQFETFDHKPKLAALDGQPMPESFTKGQPIAQLQGQELKVLRPLATFRRHGESGQEISGFLPHIAGHADDLCIIRSMHTDQINHDPAHTVMNTGTSIQGRPSMGSWVTYGLGSENDGPARLRRDDFRYARRPQPAADLEPPVAQRLPARRIPGHRVPFRRRPGALPRTARRACRRPASATSSTRSSGSTSSAPGKSITPRSRPGSGSTSWPSACRPASPS